VPIKERELVHKMDKENMDATQNRATARSFKFSLFEPRHQAKACYQLPYGQSVTLISREKINLSPFWARIGLQNRLNVN